MRISKVECITSPFDGTFMREHYTNVKSVSDFEKRVIDIMFIHGCNVEICYDKVEHTVILRYEVTNNG